MQEDSSAFTIPSLFQWTEDTPDTIQKAAESLGANPPVVETTETNEDPIIAPEQNEQVDSDLDKLSFASKIAHSMQETYKMFSEDIAIPDDLDGEALTKLIWEEASKKMPDEYKVDIEQVKLEREQQLRQQGLSEDTISRVLEYSKHLDNGGSEEVVARSMNMDLLATSELKTDEDKETVIRVLWQLKGNDPELVDAFIEKRFSTPEALDAGAEAAQLEIVKIRNAELAADAQRAAAAKMDFESKRQAEKNSLEEAIDKGFSGITLSKKEAEDLKKFMFVADQVRDADTPQGKKRMVETAEAKALRELSASPEKRVEFAYWLKYGMTGLVNTASKINMDKFMNSLGKKPITSSQESPSETPRRVETPESRLEKMYTTFPI